MKGADNKIVVVSFNYRVGPWGFLASKEVQKDGNLNVGLLDQRMAMKWVQKHIHLVCFACPEFLLSANRKTVWR